MKTAKEWEREVVVGNVTDRLEFIRHVQADAMRHCEAIAVKYAKRAGPGRCSAALSVARLIERDIYKLKADA